MSPFTDRQPAEHQPPHASRAGAAITSIRQWVAGRPQGIAVLALVIGVGGGLGAIVFRYMILGVHRARDRPR